MLVNDPDGFPSDFPPVWWMGLDSGGGSYPIGPNGPWAQGYGSGLPVVTRATALITGPLTAAPFRVLELGFGGQPTFRPRWVTDPMLLRPDERFTSVLAPEVVQRPRSLFWAEWVRSAIWWGTGAFMCRLDEVGQPLAGTLRLIDSRLLSTERDDAGALRWVLGADGDGDGRTVFTRDGRINLGGYTYRLVTLRNPHSPVDAEGHAAGVFELSPAAFGLSRQIDSYASGTFRSGIPAGYLKVDQTMNSMTQEQADELKRRWIASHGGDRRSIAVLNAFTSFVPLNLSPVDAALGEVKRLSIADVAMAFGLDPMTLGAGLNNSATYCADTETEVLTRWGWRRYDEVAVGDEIRTLNHDTGLAEWSPATEVSVFDVVDEPMRRVRAQGFDALTTLTHRWPVIKNQNTRYKTRRWTTTGLLNANDSVVLAAPSGDLPVEPKYADALVELAAWFFTEGHIHRPKALRPVAVISQSMKANPDHVARIQRALMGLFAVRSVSKGQGSGLRRSWPLAVMDPRGDMTTWRLNPAATGVLAEAFEDVRRKIVSREFLLALTDAQLRLFIDVSVWADGCESTARTFKQHDPDRMDRFLFACALAGQATNMSDGGRVVTLRHRSLANPVHAVEASAWRRARGLPLRASATDETVLYTGKVWCPTTNNQTWLARRNGAVYYTGNTNLRDAWANHRDFGLAPWIAAVEDTLTALLPSTQGVKVNLDGFANPSPKERFDGYKVAIDAGVLTPNEARALENLPPLPEPEPALVEVQQPEEIEQPEARSKRPSWLH